MTALPTFSTRNALGEFALRPVRVPGDVPLLHSWLTHPKSAYWMMTGADVQTVRREFEQIEAGSVCDAFLGLHDGAPAFLLERYDPVPELGSFYEARDGDVGMHFLVAPTERPLHGFTHAVIRVVMDFLFADPAHERVVVEPDARNTAVHRLNAAVGFRVERTISLPSKEAYLSLCTREDYRAAVADQLYGGEDPVGERSGGAS